MTGPTPTPVVDRHFVILLRAAVAASIALMIVLATFWSLTDLLTIFVSMLLPPAAWLALASVTLWALVFALRRRAGGYKQWFPLGICLVAATIGVLAPFTDLWLSVNYRFHHTARLRVIAALEARQLPTPQTSDSTMMVHLPWAASVSNGGGDILVERRHGHLMVLFFTYRGILSHYSGYIYTSDDAPALTEAFGDSVRQSRRIAPHWFFAAFY